MDRHHVRGPLAVIGDGIRQLGTDFTPQTGQHIGIINRAVGRSAAQQDGCVIRAGVSVNNHGIEAVVNGTAKDTIGGGQWDDDIRHDHGQHGGHVRANHTGSLGDAGYQADAVGLPHFPAADLSAIVGCQNSLGSLVQRGR